MQDKDKAVDIKRIKQLINLMKKNDVGELEVEQSDFKVRIKIGIPTTIIPGMAQVLSPYSATLPAPEDKKTVAEIEAVDEKSNLKTVKSPMVGTFYDRATPDKPPYAEEEGVVKQGQVLCIIEAMKVMNEIESPYEGKVVSVLVKNAQPVEYDEPLFLIEVA